MNRLEQLFDYSAKVFGLDEFLARYKDSRVNPEHRPGAIIALLSCAITARVGSLYGIERMGKGGELDRVMHVRKKPSADALAYALQKADVERLEAYNAEIIQKARRNKVHSNGTLHGWRVCAVDGTDIYSTQRPCRKAREWSVRELSNGKKERFERAVAISYVGAQPRLLIAMERVLPGEGEVSAAMRVLDKAYHRNYRYCDILCGDALYAQARFINAVVEQGKHVVIKVKQEDRHLVRDMDGLVRNQPPQAVVYGVTPKGELVKGCGGVTYDVELWDEEDFTSWDKVCCPLRCVKVRETKKVTRRGQLVETTTTEYHIATTVPKAIMRPELVWEIAHRRWDIENTVFNDLKRNWGFEHCYTHDPNGIRAVYALYCIAFNLMLLFAYKDLKDAPGKGVTLKELARQVLAGIGTLAHPLPIPRLRPG